ncbi:MAG: hypothetical protein DRJ66_02875 [Thermoprotei archaeon]|nr:MAG: hypothetical protein DRJ66_02875 [Thermoprotei archaeon]RLF20332.1 MAG: hypothetical protein DRZ82_02680 [Thermoprotei archaeon]
MQRDSFLQFLRKVGRRSGRIYSLSNTRSSTQTTASELLDVLFLGKSPSDHIIANRLEVKELREMIEELEREVSKLREENKRLKIILLLLLSFLIIFIVVVL